MPRKKKRKTTVRSLTPTLPVGSPLDKFVAGGALHRDYYPHDPDEEAYLRFLEAPGEGLGQVLGDAPPVEEVIKRTRNQRARTRSAQRKTKRSSP